MAPTWPAYTSMRWRFNSTPPRGRPSSSGLGPRILQPPFRTAIAFSMVRTFRSTRHWVVRRCASVGPRDIEFLLDISLLARVARTHVTAGGSIVHKARLLIALVLVAAIGAFFIFDLQQYVSLEFFKQKRAQIDAYYANNPWQAAAIFLGVYIAMAALSIPGAAVLTLIGGAIFGVVVGTVLVSFASAIGATLAFLGSRLLLRDWVQTRFGDRLASINAGIEKEGAFYLFALRLVPLFPFFVVNLLMGLTKIRTWTFYWVSQLGMLAGTIVYVYAGTQLGQFQVRWQLVLALVLLGIFLLVA